MDDIFRASPAALRMVLLAFLQDEEKVRKEGRTAYRSVCSIRQLIDPLEFSIGASTSRNSFSKFLLFPPLRLLCIAS
jgi:hypothetical protein